MQNQRKNGQSEEWGTKGSQQINVPVVIHQNCITNNTFHAAVQSWVHWHKIRGHLNEASKLVLPLQQQDQDLLAHSVVCLTATFNQKHHLRLSVSFILW